MGRAEAAVNDDEARLLDGWEDYKKSRRALVGASTAPDELEATEPQTSAPEDTDIQDEEDVDILKWEVKRLRKELKMCQALKDSSAREVVDLERQLVETWEVVDQLRTRAKEVVEERDQLEADNKTLMEELVLLKSEKVNSNSRLEEAVQTHKGVREEMKVKLKSLRSNNEQLLQELAICQTDRNSARNEVERLKSTLERTTRDVETRGSELEPLRDSYQSLLSLTDTLKLSARSERARHEQETALNHERMKMLEEQLALATTETMNKSIHQTQLTKDITKSFYKFLAIFGASAHIGITNRAFKGWRDQP